MEMSDVMAMSKKACSLFTAMAAVSLSLSLPLEQARAADALNPTTGVAPTTAQTFESNEVAPNVKVSNEAKRTFRSKSPRLIVALSGGGCKAVAEIGVLRVLEKHKIHIDGIIGTSMGATIGALYCAGVPLNDIEKMFISGELQENMFKGIVPRLLATPLAPVAHAMVGKPYAGLSTGESFEKFLDRRLPKTFEELKIPLGCVVTNLGDGKTEVLVKGKLSQAVLASNCVPIVCRPVEISGKLFVDGSLRANLPSEIAKSMNPDLVVSTLVDSSIKPVSTEIFRSKMQVLGRVVDILLANADKPKAADSDVLIYPDTDKIAYMTREAPLLKDGIKSGEEHAEKVAAQIERFMAADEQAHALAAEAPLAPSITSAQTAIDQPQPASLSTQPVQAVVESQP